VSAFIRFLILTFALNFVVAAMNLVPLPLFDGYHIMRNGVKNKLVQQAIVYIISASFLLTLFPWVLR
jgi:Zn-dependent protease